MLQIRFVVGLPEDKCDVQISNKEYAGMYVVRELTAQEGLDAVNREIQNNVEYQENPDKLTVAEYQRILIEAATTKDGEHIKIDFKKIPQKLWNLLVAANEKLNSLPDREARFLLSPSFSDKPQSTQQ